MRILRVSYRMPPEPGGKERHVDRLTREQLRAGHDVMVACRRGTPPPGAYRLPLRRTALSRVLAARSDVLAFAAEVARAMRPRGRFDLVHLHGDHVEAALLGRACRRAGVPLVLTVHGALARGHRRFARIGLRDVDACIALGSRPAGELAGFGVDPRRITVMSSGVDLAEIARVPAPPAREPGLIVSAGSLDPVKNHALLVAAVRELRRTLPHLRLVVAGGGPEHDRLRALAGADPGVELPGPLPRPEVYRLMRTAEVFVLASRRLPGKGEGVPTAALEALALGTPVVLSTEASLEPVVPAGGAYRTFASERLPDLVRVLGEVLADERARRRMAALGPPSVAPLDWPLVAERVESCYRAVLGTGRAVPAAAGWGGAR